MHVQENFENSRLDKKETQLINEMIKKMISTY